MKLQDLCAIVADDQKFSRDIVTEILWNEGMRDVRQARDGGEAFNMVCERAPDVLILDFEMPRDGLTALLQIRKAPASPNRELPVIMMTGFTSRERILAMRDAGAHEILAKPLTAQGLLARIHSVLTRPRPFIESEGFVGPDRRGAQSAAYRGPRRRLSDRYDDMVEIA